MSWDILDNLKSDYILLFKLPIRVPTVTYFISRSVTWLIIHEFVTNNR